MFLGLARLYNRVCLSVKQAMSGEGTDGPFEYTCRNSLGGKRNGIGIFLCTEDTATGEQS